MSSVCTHCGAPPTAGLVVCVFCKSPFPGAENGVVCPRCAIVNAHDNPFCAQCRTALTRACVFCGAASSVASPACQRCGEAFQGAEERKRQRDTMQLVGEGVHLLENVAVAEASGGGLLGALESVIEAVERK